MERNTVWTRRSNTLQCRQPQISREPDWLSPTRDRKSALLSNSRLPSYLHRAIENDMRGAAYGWLCNEGFYRFDVVSRRCECTQPGLVIIWRSCTRTVGSDTDEIRPWWALSSDCFATVVVRCLFPLLLPAYASVITDTLNGACNIYAVHLKSYLISRIRPPIHSYAVFWSGIWIVLNVAFYTDSSRYIYNVFFDCSGSRELILLKNLRVAGFHTRTRSISCTKVTAKYKPYHSNPTNCNSTTDFEFRIEQIWRIWIFVNFICGMQMLSSVPHRTFDQARGLQFEFYSKKTN